MIRSFYLAFVMFLSANVMAKGLSSTERQSRSSISRGGGTEFKKLTRPSSVPNEMSVRLKPVKTKGVREIAGRPVPVSEIPRTNTDLSAEIEDSRSEEMRAQKVWKSKKGGRPKLKTHAPMVISAPTETVDVPDHVNWNQHRDQQLEQSRQLDDFTKKVIPQRVDD
ncbi:MAG: hypothetical protein RJB66_461 [Pseudomonadota bacterium]